MLSRQAAFPLFGLRTASDLPTRLIKSEAHSVAPFLRGSFSAVLVALAYYAGSEIGFLLKPAHTAIATFWPPSAILLAAFLLSPTRNWWILLLATLPAHLVVQLPGESLSTTLWWFVANVSGPLLGAVAIRRLKKENALFNSVHGLMVFLAFGVLLPPLVKSFLNALVSLQAGRDANYWTLGATRFSANIISGLVLIPTIVMFVRNGASWFRSAKLARYIEALVLGSCTVLVSFLVFGRETGTGMIPAIIAPTPFLVWAALRFGLEGLTTSLLGVALISIWNTVHGQGPIGTLYMVQGVLVYRVLLLHSLLLVFGLPPMFTAVLIAERRRDKKRLSEARDELLCAHEQENISIARVLHTDIAGRLTLVALNLDGFETECDASARQTLHQLSGEISSICKETLDLSHEVHPFVVDYLGLAAAIRKLCRHIAAQNRMSIDFSAENVPLSLSSQVSHRLFRVAKVALRDVIQHRNARTASVELGMRSGRLLLRITSDRIDVGVPPSEGAELTSMREQLLSLGGVLRITSSHSRGLIIEACIPTSANQ